MAPKNNAELMVETTALEEHCVIEETLVRTLVVHIGQRSIKLSLGEEKEPQTVAEKHWVHRKARCDSKEKL